MEVHDSFRALARVRRDVRLVVTAGRDDHALCGEHALRRFELETRAGLDRTGDLRQGLDRDAFTHGQIEFFLVAFHV